MRKRKGKSTKIKLNIKQIRYYRSPRNQINLKKSRLRTLSSRLVKKKVRSS